MKKNVAILGATSHVAKGLIVNFLQDGEFVLHLYARSPEKASEFIDSIGKSGDERCVIYKDDGGPLDGVYDAIINCVGVGTANKLNGNFSNYFTVTARYDDLVLDYLRNRHPNTLYISLSSGAVYGGGFDEPAKEDTMNCIRVNHVDLKDYYGIVRLYVEAKHRSFADLNIVDLRLFSYFSRFIDLSDNYFITDVINSVLHDMSLKTTDSDLVRDFVHPDDLFDLVLRCMDKRRINAAFDVISTKPVKKSEILEYFSREYGLRCEIEGASGTQSATGQKNVYYSIYRNAEQIGSVPKFSSMDVIREEAKAILGNTRE